MAPPKKKKEPTAKKEEPTVKKIGLFDFVNAISYTKQDLIRQSNDDSVVKEYNPFITNRALSMHASAVMDANLLNQCSHLDKQLQFDLALGIVRKEKRFGWIKAEKDEEVELIQKVYSCNRNRALEIKQLLTAAQIEVLKQKRNSGGISK